MISGIISLLMLMVPALFALLLVKAWNESCKPREHRQKTQGSFIVNLLATVMLIAIAAVVGTWLGNHS